VRRVGHKGADLIEPGNTLESFDAALAHGVDMIELDVLPERPPAEQQRSGPGRLILAHDYEDAAARVPLTLDEGLAHLASGPFAGIEFIVDLKLPGYEETVVEAIRSAGIGSRALFSTAFQTSLVRLRQVAAESRIAWSVPRAKRDYTRSILLAGPALAALRVMRWTLPKRASAALRAGLCDALSAHWRLVSPALVEAVTGAGGELYVWTVDHAPRIRELEQLGVTGVITNDPRLFGPPAPASV
jgi:glycerophosphoryl diester phosphodiesterase